MRRETKLEIIGWAGVVLGIVTILFMGSPWGSALCFGICVAAFCRRINL